MTEPIVPPNKLQWKWVGITFVFYLLFYLLPLIVAVELFPDNLLIPGVWSFGGIMVVAAVAGYLSEGITIYEPAIAGAGLTIILLGYIAVAVFPMAFRGAFIRMLVFIFFPAVSVFVLSVSGAWLGERAQQLWKDKTKASH